MKVKFLMNVADWQRGQVAAVSVESGTKLIRTGYAEAVEDRKPKGEAA